MLAHHQSHPKHSDSRKLVENKYLYKFVASAVVWREEEKVLYLNARQDDF